LVESMLATTPTTESTVRDASDASTPARQRSRKSAR
jgi:hypothetical protein